MPKLKMPALAGLRKALEEMLLVEEEIEMWMWYGYYISFDSPSTEGWIYDGDGDRTDIDFNLARYMRLAALVRWEGLRKQKPEAVRIVEVDSVRESLESRNESDDGH